MPTNRQYSRLAKVEEGKQLRQAIKFVILSVGLIAFLAFLGVPLVARVVELVSSREESIVDSNDNTPPAPPRIYTLPEFTKDQEIKIEGSTESGATVFLHVNSTEKELLADADGIFSTRMNLNEGENIIYAVAIDTNGNESQPSKEITVNFDKTAPKIEISKPADGEKFTGSNQQQITMEGKTEEGSQMTINGRVVVVNSDGSFVFSTTLNEGENNFNIKSTDRAGNMTEMDRKVTFSL
jgi:hypothetical protein